MGKGKSLEHVGATGATAPSPATTPLLVFGLLLPGLLTALILLCAPLVRSERYFVDVERVTVNPPPEGPAHALILKSLAAHDREDFRASIFDPQLGLMVRQSYERNPWVRRVLSVRRVFPRGLHVEVEYRLPFASVERDDVYLVADRNGALLPVESRTNLLPPPLISARLAHEDGIALQGFTEAWFSDAVREGVAVLRDLQERQDHAAFSRLGIERICVANFRNRLSPTAAEIVLESNRLWSDEALGIYNRPVLVRWGRSSSHRFARAELPVETKLDNLLGVFALRPTLLGLSEIDVRFSRPFALPYDRPLAANDGP